MQDEQQSVSEILSSIRQVLSKEAETLNNNVSDYTNSFNGAETSEEVIFELTPQMQVSQGTLIDTDTAVRTQAALEKLHAVKQPAGISEQVETELRPLLREWLNTHLPDIVERIVTQEVQRLINHR